MSESQQSPPSKPKPGSLRDRIAAFEKPSAVSAAAPRPPPVRPKPGNISWKPAPPSPPANANVHSEEEKKHSGMSASDAKESIGMGGSLKERMAALQGKGAFGGAAPAPPPPGPKPVKRAPLVVSPPVEDASEEHTKELDEIVSERVVEVRVATPERRSTSESKDEEDTSTDRKEEAKKDDVNEDEDEDEAEKERERRAAIAARMARLGGTRVGMAPPILGRKPDVKPKPKPKPALAAEPETQEVKDMVVSTEERATPPPAHEVEKVSSPNALAAESSMTPVAEATPTISPPVSAEELKYPIEGTTHVTTLHEVSSSFPRVETPPEVKETASDVLRVAEEISPSETRAVPLPPPTASSPSSEQETPHSSSRSPPPSIPLPALPRRAGPPRKKSSRSLKSESKKQSTGSLVSEAPAEPSEAAPVHAETPEEHVEEESMAATTHEIPSTLTKHDSRSEHVEEHSLEPEEVTVASDATATAGDTPIDTLPAADEDETDHGVVGSTEEPIREPSPEVHEPHSEESEYSEPEVEVHTSVVEFPSEEHGDNDSVPAPYHVTELSDPEEQEQYPTHDFHGEEYEGIPEEVDHAKATSPEPADEESNVPHQTLFEPVTEPLASPPLPPIPSQEQEQEKEKEKEKETDATPAQEHKETEAVIEEEDEAARKRRIAERLAKMGARNPFGAPPFFGAAGAARKPSLDKPPETSPISPSEESPSDP